MKKLKIAFSGMGAVGGYYGGLMAACHQGKETADLFFIARGEHLKQIQRHGLQVKAGTESYVARPALATDRPEQVGPVDFLFCCTKSYDLAENIEHLKPMIAPHTCLIPLLNGADIDEQIQKLLPGQEVWKGCVYINARRTAPGCIEKFSIKERLFFGHPQAEKEKQDRLLQLLIEAKINAFNPEDIDGRIWKKFFMISMAATVTSFFNQSIDLVLAGHMKEFTQLGEELKLVADAMGISLPPDIVQSAIEGQGMMPAGSTTSMHSDFLAGNQTEVETLTGYVVRQATRLGIATPTYQHMYNRLTTRPYLH